MTGNLPLFTSEVFPQALIQYQIPLRRAPAGTQTSVLFSVDWEKDHGRWRSEAIPSYRGIRCATTPLCELLDRLAVPCTWFIEANTVHPELDMVGSCADELAFLSAREQDEIGLHVHWGNFFGDGQQPRSLDDLDWWRKEVSENTRRLAQAAGRPIASFRSGGHTLIPGLPSVLHALGYRADLSVEDRRRPMLRALQAFFGYTTTPYHPSAGRANRPGDLELLEIPTSLHLHDFEQLESRISRFLVKGRRQVLSVYIHIDELTVPQSETLDQSRLQGVERILSRLGRIAGVEFHTATSYLQNRLT